MEKFSIIIPTYNERENIKELVSQIEKSIKDLNYEIIFTDDSNDGTDKIIEKLTKENKNIKLHHRTKNKGLSKAVIEGINLASGDIIAVMDADLQHPPYLLKLMYDEMIKGADIVIPSRFISGGSDGGLNIFRKFVSFSARMLCKLNLMSLRKISDITSGIFCFRKSNLNKNCKLNGIGWKIILEILTKSNYKKIVEIPYKFNKRHSGKSKMNKQIILEYLKQLRLLRKNSIKNVYKVDKKIKKNYENIISILSFTIPIIIMLLAFVIKGVWFNAEKLSFGDMQAQYIDMLIYVKGIILRTNSTFYSILKGIGGSIYSTFTYYMLSPFNIFTIFFKNENIMYFVYLTSLIKLGLAGITMNKLLKYKNKEEYISRLMLSCCYSLMTFSISCYFCIMWTDVIYMAPLIILGLEKLINENKVTMYIVTLFLSIIFNFYMGYILCIFCIIYFIYKMICENTLNDLKKVAKLSLIFILASLIAGLLSSFIWLPTIIDMLKTSRGDVASETNLISIIKTLFIGSYDEENILFYHQPCLYCGIIVLFLVLCYLFNSQNNTKKRVATLVIYLLFLSSILIKELSYIWHGFSYPIGYNFRFSFLICLFSIIIAYQEISKINRLRKFQIIGIIIITLFAAIFIKNNLNNLYGLLSIVLLVVYLFIMSSKLEKTSKNLLMLCICLIELGINTCYSFYSANNSTTMKDYMINVCKNLNYDDNYRVFEYSYYGADSLIACDKSTTTGFYSTLNSNIVNFYTKVGLSGGANIYTDSLENTPIVDALLSVKYFYSNKTLSNYNLLQEVIVTKYEPSADIYYEEKNYIYENPYVLNFGFLIEKNEKLTNLNPFEYQNKMFKNITGINNQQNFLIEISNDKNNKNLDKSNYIYFMALEENTGFLINGVEYNAINPGEIIAIQNSWQSENIEIEFKGQDNPENYLAYYLNEELFLEGINILKENQLLNIKFKKNKIIANIDAKKSRTLMLSIPYENDFKIYLDGKKVKYKKIYEMFIGIDLTKGSHTIELIYIPKTFCYGVITSLIAFGFLIIFIKEIEKENKDEK